LRKIPTSEILNSPIKSYFLLSSVLIVFNFTDLFSTGVAFGEGFSEGNPALLSFSSLIGAGTLASMFLLKIALFCGAVLVTAVGMKAREPPLRFQVFIILVVITSMTGIVVAHNLWLISY